MRKSFKMKLIEGQDKEYEKRHNELWPEMEEMIHKYGGKNYSIFLDKETNIGTKSIYFLFPTILDKSLWFGPTRTSLNCKRIDTNPQCLSLLYCR